jgi:hypothetical protein
VLGLREVPLAAGPDVRSLPLGRVRATALSGTATVLSWTTFRRRTRWSRSSWRRGPLFISCPVALDPTALREGMTLDLRWTDGADKFGEYNLPVFGPPASQA